MSFSSPNPKLGIFHLVLLCLGSMIGAGLFSLPQNLAVHAEVTAILGAWLITFIGMFALAKVFQNLAVVRPDLDTGIYSYAQAYGGNFWGFSAAWGYWISILAGNIGYLIMISAASSTLYPTFAQPGSLSSFLLNSTIVWGATYLCLRGIKTAALINSMVTVVKIIPILIFILVIAVVFKPNLFLNNLLAHHSLLGSWFEQMQNSMLVTVWVFVGIEGAVVFSSRATTRKDIGTATLVSFGIMFALLFCISVLPFGLLDRTTLSRLSDPSTGAILSHILGPLGQLFINITLLVAVLGSFLSWVLLSAEVPYTATLRDALFPKVFALKNRSESPAGALVIGALLQQIYLLAVYLFKISYLEAISVAVTMIIPVYLCSAAYSTKISGIKRENIKEWGLSLIALLYGSWLLYAAGKQLILSSILYTVGALLFVYNRLQRKVKIFTTFSEYLLLTLFITATTVSCWMLLN